MPGSFDLLRVAYEVGILSGVLIPVDAGSGHHALHIFRSLGLHVAGNVFISVAVNDRVHVHV